MGLSPRNFIPAVPEARDNKAKPLGPNHPIDPASRDRFHASTSAGVFRETQPRKIGPRTGGRGRIRTSVARKGRQVYSLLPLAARPPVQKLRITECRSLPGNLALRQTPHSPFLHSLSGSRHSTRTIKNPFGSSSLPGHPGNREPPIPPVGTGAGDGNRTRDQQLGRL